jgi:hypothetical protein
LYLIYDKTHHHYKRAYLISPIDIDKSLITAFHLRGSLTGNRWDRKDQRTIHGAIFFAFLTEERPDNLSYDMRLCALESSINDTVSTLDRLENSFTDYEEASDDLKSICEEKMDVKNILQTAEESILYLKSLEELSTKKQLTVSYIIKNFDELKEKLEGTNNSILEESSKHKFKS